MTARGYLSDVYFNISLHQLILPFVTVITTLSKVFSSVSIIGMGYIVVCVVICMFYVYVYWYVAPGSFCFSSYA